MVALGVVEVAVVTVGWRGPRSQVEWKWAILSHAPLASHRCDGPAGWRNT